MRAFIILIGACLTGACERTPARVVVGDGNTVVVHNVKPVRLPVRVLDARGHALADSGVRFQWAAGVEVPVSERGVVTCTRSGDATVRATLGAIFTDVLVRCRPVREVRSSMMVNLVLGEPGEELLFDAVGTDGRPAAQLAGRVTVEDSTIVELDGLHAHALKPGVTWVTMRIGDHEAAWSVHVYPRGQTPAALAPGERVAVPVRVRHGDVRSWPLRAAPEPYHVILLPDGDRPRPGLAIVGANCVSSIGPQSYFGLAVREATVFVYYPQQADTTLELGATLAVWRHEKP